MSKNKFELTFSKLKTQSGEQMHIELAKEIAGKSDRSAVKNLMTYLANGDDSEKADALKVLYEIGKLNPKLGSPAADEFLELLDSKNSRLVWGAMIGLSAIASEKQKFLFDNISTLKYVASQGSIIARDQYIKILVSLAANPTYQWDIIASLLNELATAPANQFPTYAESALDLMISSSRMKEFEKILTDRLSAIDSPAKQKRVSKILEKLKK